MSIDTADVGITDADLMAHAMADDAATSLAEATTPDIGAQPRDDQGRFAARQAEPQEAAPQEQPAAEASVSTEANEPAMVPSSRLREEAEARRQAEARYERLMATLERQAKPAATAPTTQAEPVDPLTQLINDPDGFLSQREQARLAELAELKTTVARFAAVDQFGREALTAAEAWIGDQIRSGAITEQQASAYLNQGRTPAESYALLMQAHERHLDAADPVRAAKRVLDGLTPEQRAALGIAAQAPDAAPAAAPAAQSVIKLPPSLNRATSAASSATADNDMSDAALFRFATQ